MSPELLTHLQKNLSAALDWQTKALTSQQALLREQADSAVRLTFSAMQRTAEASLSAQKALLDALTPPQG